MACLVAYAVAAWVAAGLIVLVVMTSFGDFNHLAGIWFSMFGMIAAFAAIPFAALRSDKQSPLKIVDGAKAGAALGGFFGMFAGVPASMSPHVSLPLTVLTFAAAGMAAGMAYVAVENSMTQRGF